MKKIIYSHLGKVWQFLIQINTHVQYDPVIPLLDFYLREMKASVRILHVNVHIALFVTAKKLETRNKPNTTSTRMD